MVGIARFVVGTWLAAVHWPAANAEELVFVISEAVSNSVEHAYRDLHAGQVTVELTAVVGTPSRQMLVVVTDFGRWRPAHPAPGRGNGLLLIRSIVDRISIETDDAGTRVIMLGAPAT